MAWVAHRDLGPAGQEKRVTPIEHIRGFHPELTAWRQDFHAHPETGFEELRTSALVAERLAGWGIEVHRNIGRTGVVGVLRSGNGDRAIGLRADMDALDMPEANGVRPSLDHSRQDAWLRP